MKVQELLRFLQTLGGGLEVLCYTEDDNLGARGSSPHLFVISGIDTVHSEGLRDSDGVPRLKFGRSSISQEHVLLEITSDF